MHQADGGHVVVAKNGRGWRLQSTEHGQRPFPRISTAGAQHNQRRVERDARLSQGLAIAGQPVQVVAVIGRAGQVGDTAVAKLDQVVRRQAAAMPVVHVHGKGIQPVLPAVAVDQHHRHAEPFQVVVVQCTDPRRSDDDPIHALGPQHLDSPYLSVGLGIGADQDDGVAMVVGGAFDCLHDLTDKGIGDGGHHDADRLGPAHDQAAGLGVGGIAHVVGQALDAGLGLRAHERAVTQRPRNRRVRNPCRPCDVFDRNRRHSPNPAADAHLIVQASTWKASTHHAHVCNYSTPCRALSST